MILENFSDFVGNEGAIEKIKLMVAATKKDDHQFPHMGFFGPPGHGKTTAARIVAEQLERKFVYINSVAVKHPMTFRGIITDPQNSSGGALVVLDECHRLPGSIQDNLLSVLEEPAILVTNYKHEVIRDKLPTSITFIFATTHNGLMRDALLSRLESVEFHEYSTTEKQMIAANYLVKKYGFDSDSIELDAITDIGRRSRSGRHVVNNCDNIVRYMNVNSIKKLNMEIVNKVFSILGYDSNGLTPRDKLLLRYLAGSGQVGLDTLEAYLNTPKNDIRSKIEPWLLRKRFIIRQASGRVITERGIKALQDKVVD